MFPVVKSSDFVRKRESDGCMVAVGGLGKA